MKKIIVLMLGLLFFKSTQAQEMKSNVDGAIKNRARDTTYTAITSPPEFDGLGKYISSNLHYPKWDLKNNVQGKVYLQFIVEKDGSLSSFTVLRGPDKYMIDKALRVMQQCPKWKPGIQNGKPVRCLYTMPISFTLSSE